MAYISSYAVISMMTMVIPVYMWQRWRQIGIKSAVATADRLLMTSINFYGPQNIIYCQLYVRDHRNQRTRIRS